MIDKFYMIKEKIKEVIKEVLSELLTTENYYPYEKKGRYSWFYNDFANVRFYVKLLADNNEFSIFSLKSGYYNELGNSTVDPAVPEKSKAKDEPELWDKISNTVAKIFKDEILPMFLSSKNIKTIYVDPVSLARYNLSFRMFKKFIPLDKIEIKEVKSTRIYLNKIE